MPDVGFVTFDCARLQPARTGGDDLDDADRGGSAEMWFEDIEIGGKRVLGTHTFTEDEIIAFARKYDPQTFHIDPEAAKASLFGGLIA